MSNIVPSVHFGRASRKRRVFIFDPSKANLHRTSLARLGQYSGDLAGSFLSSKGRKMVCWRRLLTAALFPSCPMDFPPLKHPTPWPPTERPPSRFDGLPVIGGFLAWVSAIATGDQHNKLLYDIECQICEQLAARPTDNHDWPKGSTGRRIVDALSKAVREEKETPLDHVTLHPEDPIVLLWWGCYDNLTPLVSWHELDSEFDVRISRDEWHSIFSFSDDW